MIWRLLVVIAFLGAGMALGSLPVDSGTLVALRPRIAL